MILCVSIAFKLYIYDKMIKKKNIHTVFIQFLFLHLFVWTLIPSVTNENLPLDTIEALAWGSNLDWGFFKHPPLSALALELFYFSFANQDWAYYFLSQIFVIISFYVVWKFSLKFLKDSKLALISVLILEGIYFYNFTTPEFNVNVCQLPFWALTVYFTWQSIEDNKIKNFILLGIFAALGFLSKYLFIYLLLSIKIFFIAYFIKNKKLSFKYFIPAIVFLIIISPHLFWLIENNFSTFFYAIDRTGLETYNYFNHIKNPTMFLLKQIGILSPVFLMLFILIKKFENKINFDIKNKKLLFLIFVNFLPILLILLTSVLTGAKIRTMWMTPFYLFFGTFLIYVFKKMIDLQNLKKFAILFVALFLISPSVYLFTSISENNKRTDYPGAEIADLVQSRWNKNFSNEIEIIVGDEWFGGNLSYHLYSRPKWFYFLDNSYKKQNIVGGFIFTQKKNLLTEKMCPGIYGIIKIQAICMIGKK